MLVTVNLVNREDAKTIGMNLREPHQFLHNAHGISLSCVTWILVLGPRWWGMRETSRFQLMSRCSGSLCPRALAHNFTA